MLLVAMPGAPSGKVRRLDFRSTALVSFVPGLPSQRITALFSNVEAQGTKHTKSGCHLMTTGPKQKREIAPGLILRH